MEEEQKFYDLYKKGAVSKDAINDYIEEWNTSDSKETLRNFLGLNELNEKEYMDFVLLNRLPEQRQV